MPSQHLLDAAVRYEWPGNLRELENFVKRYVILEDDEGSLRELVEMSAARQRSAPRAESCAIQGAGTEGACPRIEGRSGNGSNRRGAGKDALVPQGRRENARHQLQGAALQDATI